MDVWFIWPHSSAIPSLMSLLRSNNREWLSLWTFQWCTQFSVTTQFSREFTFQSIWCLRRYFYWINVFICWSVCFILFFLMFLVILLCDRFAWSGFYICNIECRCSACHYSSLCPWQYIVVRLWFKPSSSIAICKTIGKTETAQIVEMGRLFSWHQFWHEICTEIFRCAWNWRWCP